MTDSLKGFCLGVAMTSLIVALFFWLTWPIYEPPIERVCTPEGADVTPPRPPTGVGGLR